MTKTQTKEDLEYIYIYNFFFFFQAHTQRPEREELQVKYRDKTIILKEPTSDKQELKRDPKNKEFIGKLPQKNRTIALTVRLFFSSREKEASIYFRS